MSEVVNQSIKKIGGGALLVFAGIALAMLFGFISRIVIVRYLSEDDYGVFSLAFVILNMLVLASTLGLQTGLPRQIGFYRGKDNFPKVRGLVRSALMISIISGILVALVLFTTSDIISENIFDNQDLSSPLRIFSIAIPFFTLIYILATIFRGFDRTGPQVYFENIMRNALFILILIPVIWMDCSLDGVIYAFVSSILITFIAFTVYAIKKPPFPLKSGPMSPIDSETKALLIFSIPLLTLLLINHVALWADTVMIGYFMEDTDVGVYNVAVPLVNLLPIFLTAIRFLYVPLMSELYAKNQFDEIKRSYQVLTKWISSLTLPVFLVFLLFPEATLNFLFGSRYVDAASALQILSIGFFISTAFGPNGVTLVSMGKTRLLTWSAAVAVVANIILNIILIPPMGISGAAIATTSSLAIRNILVSVSLYIHSGIHPFTRNYIKPTLVSVILAFGIYAIIDIIFDKIPLWLLPLSFLLFLGSYALSLLITRSFDKEDIMMILTIEKKLGMNLTGIKKVLSKWV